VLGNCSCIGAREAGAGERRGVISLGIEEVWRRHLDVETLSSPAYVEDGDGGVGVERSDLVSWRWYSVAGKKISKYIKLLSHVSGLLGYGGFLVAETEYFSLQRLDISLLPFPMVPVVDLLALLTGAG
jgi:hypothetical protein